MKTDPLHSSTNPVRESSATAPGETRNARGEWQPSCPAKYAPLIVWPPKPRELILWFVNWPGFVWPINAGLLVISVMTWLFLMPPLEKCSSFHWGWILQVYLVTLAWIWIVYGSFYLLMYMMRVDGTKGKYTNQWPDRPQKRFLFNNQVYDNVFWTAGVGGLMTTGYLVLGLWLFANHYIPYLSWEEHPALFCLWIVVIPFWREFHFYWIHRFIHWKPLYKRIHSLHHKNVDVNPWSGMAMHPIEQFLYLSVCAIHFVIASHPFHFLFDLQHAALGPVSGHLGFEGPVVKGKVPIGSYFHYLHHRYFECNYGESMLPLDRWFGTFRDGLPDGEGSKLNQEHRG
ncbi:sterol desaturase family protein [bacterium]|jgi:sterol desaturase/sphingolipid hydroxylase (fatty acid hydroxylase superfamily)|nr:sterol desaturase family protein [bacterium]NBS51734.1 sterol desaturase family protein [Spartobacteria bacterium]